MQKIKNPKTSQQAGFTLIELLVVIVIIAVLSGLGLNSFFSAQVKSRDAKRKGDLRNIAQTLEAYLNDYDSYPVDSDGKILGCGEHTSLSVCSWGNPFKLKPNATSDDIYYMTELPNDPRKYQYYYESDGTKYVLYAKLENEKDQAIPRDGDNNSLVYKRLDDSANTDCNTAICNYAVSSNNVPSLNPISE